MSPTPTTASAIDTDEDGLFRVGAIAALAIAIAYIVIIGLYASVGVPPEGGQARLDYFVGKSTAWWAIIGISVLTNFLYVPLALALYVALRAVHRYATLLGVAFVGLFVVLENAVSWTGHGALILLSEAYAESGSESQRASFVGAATYVSAVLESPLARVWAIGTLSFAFLVIGWVMTKGVFSKPAAYLGILTGVFGLIAVAGVSVAVYANAIAATIWLFMVGHRLNQLSHSSMRR